MNGKASVTDAVLRDIADRLHSSVSPPSKSTVIIHSSKKVYKKIIK